MPGGLLFARAVKSISKGLDIGSAVIVFKNNSDKAGLKARNIYCFVVAGYKTSGKHIGIIVVPQYFGIIFALNRYKRAVYIYAYQPGRKGIAGASGLVREG